MSGNVTAPEGAVWVCAACGKRSRDQYGDRAIDRGWDASCMLNAVLCVESSVKLGDNGRVASADAFVQPLAAHQSTPPADVQYAGGGDE